MLGLLVPADLLVLWACLALRMVDIEELVRACCWRGGAGVLLPEPAVLAVVHLGVAAASLCCCCACSASAASACIAQARSVPNVRAWYKLSALYQMGSVNAALEEVVCTVHHAVLCCCRLLLFHPLGRQAQVDEIFTAAPM